MREIKFRVWDNEENNFWGEGRNLSMISLVSDSVVNDDSTVLEQYTGLKDKNGVEIYEGDILKRHTKREFGIDGYIGKVIYVNKWAKFVFYIHDGLEFNLYKSDVTDYEVIGNIHENADLLNDTDRIIPDDIGNDIHDFLHGGDK